MCRVEDNWPGWGMVADCSLLVAVTPLCLAQLGRQLSVPIVDHVLLAGLITSRFGLWLFDLSVCQMLQEWVAVEELGKLLVAICKKKCKVQ